MMTSIPNPPPQGARGQMQPSQMSRSQVGTMTDSTEVHGQNPGPAEVRPASDVLGLLKDAILQDLFQALGDRFRSLDSHAGAFEGNEARRFALPSPALRIAVTGWRGVVGDDDSSTLVQAQIAFSILARDESALRRRDVVALELAQAVMLRLLAGGYLSPDQLGSRVRSPQAHEITARALYDGDTDRNGFAIWSIEAPYVVDLAAPIEASSLSLKDLWLARHPKVGALHILDYQRIATSETS